ncbi:SBBP repeat-containing protein [Leptospira sp. WS92.C1]
MIRFFLVLILSFQACAPIRGFNAADPGSSDYWIHLLLQKIRFFRENEGNLEWTLLLGSSGLITSGMDTAVDAHGSIYVAGETQGGIYNPSVTGITDLFIGKYDPQKNIIWGKQIGVSSATIQVKGVAVDSIGSAYVTGSVDAPFFSSQLSSSDLFLVKYNPDGTQAWGRQTGPSGSFVVTPSRIDVDIFGNSYIIGTSNGPFGGPASSGTNGFIIKFDTNGNQLWVRQNAISGANYNSNDVAFDRNTGSIYMTGFGNANFDTMTVPGIGNNDLFIVKFDTDGNRQFFAQLGFATRETQGHSLAVDGSGNIFAGGSSNGNFGSGADGSSTLGTLVKYSPSGVQQWVTQFGAPFGSGLITQILAIGTDVGGNVFTTGTTQSNLVEGGSSIGSQDQFVIKHNSLGQVQWIRQTGVSSGSINGSGIQSDSEGNLYCVGTTNRNINGVPVTGSSDLFLLKYR